MKIKIEWIQKEKMSKKKEGRMISMGKHQKMVLALWLLLSCSFAFDIYKNFTVISQHTTHVKMAVKEEIINTSEVKSLTKNFVKEYFSWKNNREMTEKGMNNPGQYPTEEGLALSQDMVRIGTPTSSEINSVEVLDAERRPKDFTVSFLIDQEIMKGKKPEQISSAYRVKIFEDEKESRIVTSLPTMIGKSGKAEYEAKQIESDPDIDAKTMQEVTEFLKTFFKLYPIASEKEPEYYNENESVSQAGSDPRLVETTSPIYLEKDGSVQVKIVVKYLNETEEVINSFQYNLLLNKEENWKIISGEQFFRENIKNKERMSHRKLVGASIILCKWLFPTADYF